MSVSDIDDGECDNFVNVLMHNRHLKELDMSGNLLGKDENLSSVNEEVTTGGVSIAGAETLCDSLRFNTTLTELNLSYNAIGQKAANILGAALLENKAMCTLNLANNGIDAVGAFTILVGARDNPNLHYLNLDGNPI
eukprot:gene28500-31803_t